MDGLKTLKSLMKVGLTAADPYRKIYENLPDRPLGRLLIVSLGKAASRMAEAAADFYQQDYEGFILTPRGYGRRIKGFQTFEGTHPVPSQLNVEITQKIMREVEGLHGGDMLLALISGGTSALLCAPEGVTLGQKIKETEALLKSGKPVRDINERRKDMSAVKGGKLADLARPARVKTLIISDVAGDDPLVVGSAPTGGGTVVLSADAMLGAIKGEAEAMGISVENFGQVEGEARAVAGLHAIKTLTYPGKRPHLIISGGETSVTVAGGGRGGRNTEYALALAMSLDRAEGIYALAIDTDGHDGTGPFAGAMVDPGTLVRAIEAGLIPEKSLKNNNSGGFFEAAGGLIETGPTLTNLNDLRMILLV